MLRPRKRRRRDADAGTIYTAGPVERFEPGSVTAFPEGPFYLARLDGGGFLALNRTCTHLGCTVPWIEEDRQFACPCHASVFDITGAVLSPPADRALDMYAVRIENGIVKVDLSGVIKRQGFETAQVTMP
ncbi:MAG: Rieske (2Fe-2S) protein [Candidatus Krumholzibacteria bacterium]|nr:Rieske (2Fe-2S) protein [Candidatus Krumholzibacteria bacterium]